MNYVDRQDAGRQLAAALQSYKDQDVVVLALPRGGIVLGAAVAHALHAPLGLVLVRKIAHPAAPEYALGAIAEGDVAIYDEHAILQVDEEWIEEAEAQSKALIDARRNRYYGDDFTPPSVTGKTVIIVDDGIATGLTFQAAIQAIRRQNPARVIVAAPVASQESVYDLRSICDDIIILGDPHLFSGAVGAHYDRFEQVNDEEVRKLLWEVQDDIQKTTPAGTLSLTSR